MHVKVILLASVMTVLISCNETKKEKTETDYIAQNKSIPDTMQENEGYTLLKNNCYVCHSPNTKSHDEIIAPPFVAVKRRYNRQYNNKEEFVNAVVNWVQNPNEEKALMRGAVRKFKVMPKLPLETENLQKIASYIYDTNVEEPEWFGEHVKEMHGDGMRMGKGKGKGRKNN